MISKNSKISICCKTEQEQNMLLDIFEMLGMRWREGQLPRGYPSRQCPMYYQLTGQGSFGQGIKAAYNPTIMSSELRNQWISLKLKTKKEQPIITEIIVDDDWLAEL